MKKPKILEIISECEKLSFDSFGLFYTSEIKETDIKPYYWNHYIESYLLCNYRFSSIIRDINTFSQLDFTNKACKVFLTTNRDLYKEILKDSGMNWVNDDRLKQKFGFVSNGINVSFIDYDVLTKYLPPRSYELDSISHEFTHILLPAYINHSKSDLNHYWSNVIEEGFAVLLNKQYEEMYQMKKDLLSNQTYDLKSICYKQIKENGFFAIDQRYVTENYEYQYSATVVKFIDKYIRKDTQYKSSMPLSGIYAFTQKKLQSKN